MSPTRGRRRHVIVDGSNLATEGRVLPSLAQLDEAVAAYRAEDPSADVVVVVDATFEHRAAPAERGRFQERVLAGDIVTPPAGAVGRGDAFILKIADRVGGVVLSNDSFQEFQETYPWLFDEDRLIGGKPVRGIGWIFTPRLPVRGPQAARAAKKARAQRAADAEAPDEVPVAKKAADAKRPPAVESAVSAPAKATRTRATAKKAADATKAPALTSPAKEPSTRRTRATAKKATDVAKALAPTSPAKEPSTRRTRATAKKAADVAKAPAPKPPAATSPGAPALRRERQPVNPEDVFAAFAASHRIGSKVSGEVIAFTSHGAIVAVTTRSKALVQCYVPTTSLGTPAPSRARDVLKRGDTASFRLVHLDPERRIAELALA